MIVVVQLHCCCKLVLVDLEFILSRAFTIISKIMFKLLQTLLGQTIWCAFEFPVSMKLHLDRW